RRAGLRGPGRGRRGDARAAPARALAAAAAGAGVAHEPPARAAGRLRPDRLPLAVQTGAAQPTPAVDVWLNLRRSRTPVGKCHTPRIVWAAGTGGCRKRANRA